jgi:hypothetical protein
VFNIQPGTGLGFSASKEIALGLGGAFGAIIAFARKKHRGFLRNVGRLMK